MKKNIKLLLKLFRSFGIKNGTRLFFNFKLNKLNNLRLPNIKTAISLRSGTSDVPTFHQIFLKNEYNFNFPGQPKIIIDGGANIGLFTILMKERFPDAKIICIEPDVENYQLLQKNVSLYDNVHCENCGLWNKEVMLKVYDKFNLGKWAVVVEENNEEGNIKAISINNLMSKYSIDKIDILKLDIETSEKQVFLENYESWLPKTKMLVIELHDWIQEDCSKPFFEAINKTFKKYSYSMMGENTIIINNDIS